MGNKFGGVNMEIPTNPLGNRPEITPIGIAYVHRSAFYTLCKSNGRCRCCFCGPQAALQLSLGHTLQVCRGFWLEIARGHCPRPSGSGMLLIPPWVGRPALTMGTPLPGCARDRGVDPGWRALRARGRGRIPLGCCLATFHRCGGNCYPGL